jgi:nicotinate-nucleotide adenylyltransferase
VGGAALGTDLTAAPRPIVPGSLGVFGGTFDPIHVAHLAVAQEAAESLGLERVLFIPAGRPPHKDGWVITPAHHRLAMVELAVADNERFGVDRLELDREGPSYTVDTLAALREARLAAGETADLTLILSSEAFLGLPTWHDPHRLLELARVAVVPRDGYPDADPAFMDAHLLELADGATFLDGPRLRMSASELRDRAAVGRSLRYLVPDAVAAYIGDHALYRNPRRNPAS